MRRDLKSIGRAIGGNLCYEKETWYKLTIRAVEKNGEFNWEHVAANGSAEGKFYTTNTSPYR